MKERLLTGWTFQRAIFVIVGLIIAIQAIVALEWLGAILGGYLFMMGLFGFGCATRGCFSGNCHTEPSIKKQTSLNDVEFEEVKTK